MSQNLSSAAVVIGALRVYSLHAGKFFMLFLSSAGIFQNQPFSKKISGISSACQTVLIQIWPKLCQA